MNLDFLSYKFKFIIKVEDWGNERICKLFHNSSFLWTVIYCGEMTLYVKYQSSSQYLFYSWCNRPSFLYEIFDFVEI